MDASRTAQIAPDVHEKRERNPAQGEPQGQVETKRSPKDSSASMFVGFQRILRFAQKRFTADVAISAT